MRKHLLILSILMLSLVAALVSSASAGEPANPSGPLVELNLNGPNGYWLCGFPHGPWCGEYSAPRGTVLELWYRQQDAERCTDYYGGQEVGHQPEQHFTFTVADRIVWAVDCWNIDGSGGKELTIVPLLPPPPPPPGPPQNLRRPQVLGDLENGGTLTVTPGEWLNATRITYQWQACAQGSSAFDTGATAPPEGDSPDLICDDVPDATATTYAVGDNEVGRTVRVNETAYNEFGSTSATSDRTDVIYGGVINGSTARREDRYTSFGFRHLCQNLGENPADPIDPRNGCRKTSSRGCCNGELIYGTRADMKAPTFSWRIPDDEAGLMRLAAEGGFYNAYGELQGSLLQGGFVKLASNVNSFDGDSACNTNLGVKRRFAERAWETRLTGHDYLYRCQFFKEVSPGEHVIVKVMNRAETLSPDGEMNDDAPGDGDDWSIYFNGARAYNHEDSMRRASEIYAGGEFSLDRTLQCGLYDCRTVSTDCIGAGYGVDGTLPWQRARERGFGDPFTIQRSYRHDDKGKWFIGPLTGGFWIQNHRC